MFYHLQNLRAFGARPCLLHSGITSYAELADMAELFARTFPAARSLVAIEMLPEPTPIAAYIGALSAGHAVILLPANDPEQGRRVEQRFRPAATCRQVGNRLRLRLLPDPAQIHPDLALLLQTSGSTGQGRGVRLSASAVQANAASIVEYLQIGEADRAALVLPLHYSYGLSVLHSHLLAGASIWLANTSVLDPRFGPALAASHATSLAGVPHHFQMLESSGLADALPPLLDCLTVAGGAMEPAAVQRWAARMKHRSGRFMVMYGQTEATARIAYLPPDLATRHPEAVGITIPGGKLSLCDAGGREISAPETEGELVYQGPNVMMGYADAASDLAEGPELTELATGDLARRDCNGIYRITGRLSRMSKIAGLRIGHDALERALAEVGHEVAVWGDDETIGIATAGPVEGIAAKAGGLTGIGLQHFSVIHRDPLPRRPNGKVDYPALRLLPQPQAEADVLSAFALTFAPRPVTSRDSFATLGGDSLQHVELSLALDRLLGPAPMGWEAQSIAELQRPKAAPQSRMPTAVLIRALAILAVVIAHQTLWPIHGGAAAMMILFGLSMAEHRRQALVQRNVTAILAPLGRVLWPYFILLMGFALAWGQVPWASVVLLGNFGFTTPETGLMLPYLYWFVEVYVQITLLVLLLLWPQKVRDWVGVDPFTAGLALLALAFTLRLTIPEIWPMNGREQFTLPWVFYLFALGWCAVVAESRRQKIMVVVVSVVVLSIAPLLGGNWYGGWLKYISLFAVIVALLYSPHVPVHRHIRWSAMYLAQAAFPIYLLHRFVPEVVLPRSGLAPGPMADALAIFGGIALGLFAAHLQRLVSRSWRMQGRSWLTRLSTLRTPQVAVRRRA